ncbi:MAG: hypothetical protein M5U01_26590 [Ardenticatenaceae bacterium]|nr:hypothetical protein [Ardenticatenaceae bacterium]HBY95458.1 hypothetical protein [Chloroflexota bacterium]
MQIADVSFEKRMNDEEVDFPVPVRSLAKSVTLRALPANGIGDNVLSEPTGSLLERFPPPYDLTSDMMFVAAFCRAAPLQQTFPGVPFLSTRGNALLVMWFSRVKEICYRDESHERRCIGSVETVLYHELNVVALLGQRALFVPGIYATSDLTIRIGHHYGMPKEPTTMSVWINARRVESEVVDGRRRSFLKVRLLGSGRWPAAIVSRFWPWRTWPARFPDGREVRPLIERTPRVQIAHVQAGQLALQAAWLPEAVRLLPLGLYVPNLRMQLPPP